MNSNKQIDLLRSQYNKCLTTIKSCKTIDHCKATEKMIYNMAVMWTTEDKKRDSALFYHSKNRVTVLQEQLSDKIEEIFNYNEFK